MIKCGDEALSLREGNDHERGKMSKHRPGIILGSIIVFLGGGALGFILGVQQPGLIQHYLPVSSGSAPILTATAFALLAAIFWGIGEFVSGIFGFVERRAIVIRLGFAIIGSLISVATSSLQLVGVIKFVPNPTNIFDYQPIITGLGSAALGVHALVHQVRLNRDTNR